MGNYNLRLRIYPYDRIEQIRKLVRNPTYFTSIKMYRLKDFTYSRTLEKIQVNKKNYERFRFWIKKRCFGKDINFLIETKDPTNRNNTSSLFFTNILIYGIEQNTIEYINKKIKK